MLELLPRFDGKMPAGLSELAISQPTLARIYAARNINDIDELNTALTHLLAAENLLGIDDAVSLLDTAIDNNQRILIVGDFDCDGATSTALMVRGLKEIGATVDFIVPDRFKYGYGLTPEIVDLGIDTFSPDVIVTVDNGISSHAGVNRAKENNITVIITDHHLTSKPKPQADAVVNPNQLGCSFLSKSLVGVGVAFYILGRLAKYRRQANKSSCQVSKYLDLVALGTIADVGILDKNNRILVHHGLSLIRQGSCCVGILAILEQAGKEHHKVTAQDFGFVIGPRINAAGRMDNMKIGIECLISDDWGMAQKLAYQLDKLNQQRRHVEGKIKEQADDILQSLQQSQIDDDVNKTQQQKGLVLYQDDWHQGVIGIVAGRLKETYYKPAIVFAPADTQQTSQDDLIKGSARSIDGIHIRDAIEKVAEAHPQLISHFGGHAMAAGLTLKKQNFNQFAEAFDTVLADIPNEVFAKQQYTDGQLTATDFSLSFINQLQSASIWGHGFVLPLFDGVFEVVQAKILKDKHLKLLLSYPDVLYPIDAIWFNYNSDVWDYRAKQVHVLFELAINEWNGQKKLQLMIKDLSVESTA